MDDASHLLQYRRFFGTLFSVLPGLELTYALSALVLYLLADVAEIEWGWGIGFAGITFVLTLSVWLFVGMGIQKWAEEKTATFLFILNAPFLVVFFGFMFWLFYETVINATSPGAAPAEEHALLVLEQLRALV
ncbi:MAG: hypothetical protein M5U28_34965 [Sandaracinaceae bacterium]|nr:hypothetical protein [Sandaracinaceae bacterium]